MKAKKKICYLIGLLIPICSFAIDNSYEQQGRTKGAVEKPLKIYGSGTIKATYNKNHPAAGSLSPALISLSSPEDTGEKGIDPSFTGVGATVGLAKTMLWGEDPTKLALVIAISEGKTGISKACGELKSWILGMQASNFGDPDIAPDSLEGAPNSAVGSKAIQLRFKQHITPNISWAFSLEEAAAFKLSAKYKDELKKEQDQEKLYEITQWDEDTPEVKECNDKIKNYKNRLSKQPLIHQPAIAVSFRFNYPGSRGHLGIGLLGRLVQHYDTNTQQTCSPLAGGMRLGTKLQLAPKQTTLKLQGVIGRGIGAYIADLAALKKEDNTAYVQVNDRDNSISLHIINAYGAYLALEHQWWPQLHSTLIVSGLQTVSNPDRENDHYKTGLYGSFSTTYHPAEQLYFRGQYTLGRKTSIDGTEVFASAFIIAVGFKF